MRVGPRRRPSSMHPADTPRHGLGQPAKPVGNTRLAAVGGGGKRREPRTGVVGAVVADVLGPLDSSCLCRHRCHLWMLGRGRGADRSAVWARCAGMVVRGAPEAEASTAVAQTRSCAERSGTRRRRGKVESAAAEAAVLSEAAASINACAGGGKGGFCDGDV